MSAPSSQTYPIGGPTRVCAATGEALPVGSPIVVALIDTPDDPALLRMDFARDAWEKGARPEAPMRVFAFWRTEVAESTAKPRQLLADDELMELFEQLADEDSPRRRAFRYMLALVLMRRKLLLYEGGTPADPKRGVEGELVLRARGKGGSAIEPYRVIDPGLDDESISAATEELGQVLNLEEAAGSGS